MSTRRNSVVALCPTSCEIMSIDISIDIEGRPSVKKSMARAASEQASRCLERMSMLLATSKKPEKGKKMSREDVLAGCPQISFTTHPDAAEPLTGEESNEIFWSRISKLHVGEHVTLDVLYNIPTVTNVTAPTSLAVGIPAMCTDVRVLFSNSSDIVHEWRALDGGSGAVSVVCSGPVFVPLVEHVGKQMRYRCAPSSAKDAVDSLMWTEVELPPVKQAPPSQPRWEHTKCRANKSTLDEHSTAFRVMTYNILHNDFCTSKFAKLKLYPFATEEMLSLPFRQNLIAREIASLQADIVCLQECGKDMLQRFLEPTLHEYGFHCEYTNKNGQVREGCLTAVRRDRFTVLKHYRFPLVMSSFEESHKDLAAAILREHPHLDEALRRVTSIGAVTLCRDNLVPGKTVIIGNTHLFYHANACHIRALQVYLLLHHMNDVINTSTEFANDEERQSVVKVLCGDFNFTRTTGGYKLVTEGAIDETNSCWEKGYKFWWGCDRQLGVSDPQEEAEAAGNALTSQGPPTNALKTALVSPLPPLLDTHIGDPNIKWTNYALTFKEIIDHIFVDKRELKVLRTVPLPSEAELSANVAIPSSVFPSDHVSLVVDVDYLTKVR